MQDKTNKENLIIIALLVAGLIFIGFSLETNKKTSGILPQLSTIEPINSASTFQPSTAQLAEPSPVAQFDWFDDIDAPQIHNKKQLSKVWQSKPRCCVDKKELQKNNREFYKACYVAIQQYPSNNDIEAFCLWLMDIALESAEERLKHNEYFIKKFFYYDRPLNNCANCAPANVSARIAQQLSRQYKNSNRFDEAVKLLERMSDERHQETSDWVLAELTTQLGKYYLDPQYIGNNFERIKINYIKLEPTKDNEILGETIWQTRAF